MDVSRRLSGKSLLIMGGGHHQLPMVEAARRLGIFSVVCDANPQSYCRTHCDLFYPVSFTDLPALTEIVRAHKIDGVSTIGTNQAIYWVAKLKEEAGLPSLLAPSDLINRAINKDLWRPVLEANGISVPVGASSSDPDRLKEMYTARAALPMVLKPGDGAGGAGVKAVFHWDAYAETFAYSQMSSSSRVVVAEECIEGVVIGIESLVTDGRVQVLGIADKQMSPLPAFTTLGCIAPTRLNAVQQELVKQVNERALRSLGIDWGPSHIDMIVRDKQVYVVDIGCRLAGGPVIFEILNRCYNASLIDATILQALGQPAFLEDPVWQGYYRGSRHWFPGKSGRLKRIHVPQSDLMANAVRYLRFWKHPGDDVARALNDTGMIGSFVCEGQSFEDTAERLDRFMNAVRYEYE